MCFLNTALDRRQGIAVVKNRHAWQRKGGMHSKCIIWGSFTPYPLSSTNDCWRNTGEHKKQFSVCPFPIITICWVRLQCIVQNWRLLYFLFCSLKNTAEILNFWPMGYSATFRRFQIFAVYFNESREKDFPVSTKNPIFTHLIAYHCSPLRYLFFDNYS